MNEWQPIGTAPKDFSDVLFWASGRFWVGHWWVDRSDDGYREEDCFVMVPVGMDWNGIDLKTHFQAKPTHWMPLPAAPEQNKPET